MEDEANLCSPNHSTFEMLVVQHAVGHRTGPIRCLMPVAGNAVFGTSHQFAEHISQM